MKQPRLQLSDGTRLGSQFSQRVWDALDRAEWKRVLPKLPRGHIRFRASDGGIHDIPRRFISEALGIDQRRCWATGQRQNFRILENAALREHDRDVMRTLRDLVLAAARGLPRRTILLTGGTKLRADFSQRVWDALDRQDKPQKNDKQILRTFRYLLMAAQNRDCRTGRKRNACW